MIKPELKNQDARKENPLKKERLLLVTRRKGNILSLLMQDGVLIRAFSSSGKDLNEGSICIGKITDIKEDIQAAFLLIAGGQKCFIHIKELTEEYNLSAKGRAFCCGDNFLVRIKKLPSKGKLATASTHLKGFTYKEREELLLKAEHLSDFSVLYDAKFSYVDELIGTDEAFYPDRIVTDETEIFNGLKEHIASKYVALADRLSLYQDELVSLNVLYGIEGKLSDALSKKVWLKSGGFLYIEPTEAMTVIDVNSGKSDRNLKGEEAALAQNLEALKEIARQILLRNLSGIIIIDFICMKQAENREFLLKSMKNELKNDPASPCVVDMTKLDLMEITRKKANKTLYEQFFV